MSLDRVLGVIDLLAGRAVHAVAGRRGQYQPHPQNARCSPDPVALAKKYRQSGVGGLYVADLDAITGGPFQGTLLRKLAAGDLPVWIDAGIHSAQDWQQKRAALKGVQARWILATETLTEGDLNRWSSEWEDRLGAAFTLGVDLSGGRVRCAAGKTTDQPAIELVGEWYERGIRSFLPLEITSVGVSAGPATESLCHQIRRKFPDVELLSGGGVRNSDDLERLLDAGCDRVLVATALINGSIPPLTDAPSRIKS